MASQTTLQHVVGWERRNAYGEVFLEITANTGKAIRTHVT